MRDFQFSFPIHYDFIQSATCYSVRLCALCSGANQHHRAVKFSPSFFYQVHRHRFPVIILLFWASRHILVGVHNLRLLSHRHTSYSYRFHEFHYLKKLSKCSISDCNDCVVIQDIRRLSNNITRPSPSIRCDRLCGARCILKAKFNVDPLKNARAPVSIRLV